MAFGSLRYLFHCQNQLSLEHVIHWAASHSGLITENSHRHLMVQEKQEPQYLVRSDKKVCCLSTNRPAFGNEHRMYVLNGQLNLSSRCLWTVLLNSSVSLTVEKEINSAGNPFSICHLGKQLVPKCSFLKGAVSHFGNVFPHCLAES